MAARKRTSTAIDLTPMPASQFVKRLSERAGEPESHYVLWLGAGCSVSSGIPAARTLVHNQWLPQLQRQLGATSDIDEWASSMFPHYEKGNPAALYGELMEKLFIYEHERQRETERLCDGRSPGFGYAVLAALMAGHGGMFNTVVTTNFDDLIADAMYVFTDRKPLVIQHETLARFVRPSRVQRPLVVKVHGDHRLNPLHTAVETDQVRAEIATGVRGLLHDRGVVFTGYSGNDEGVVKMLSELPKDALPLGVWWISRHEPQGTIRPWLESRKATWVQADDFDRVMLLFRDAFAIEHPTVGKFEKMIDAYRSTYEKLNSTVEQLPDTDTDAGPLKHAAQQATTQASAWWRVVLDAQAVEQKDPDLADQIYSAAVDATDPQQVDARLLGSYALFLQQVRGDDVQAEQFYRRAIDADPNNAINLGNYAFFLRTARQDYEQAEQLYRRAIDANPNNADNLGNYAIYLQTARRDYEQAERFYRYAIDADPHNAGALGGYAVFLQTVRRDYEQAEQLFRRAIDADPNDADNLGNYAGLLIQQGNERQALDLIERAFTNMAPRNEPLAAELWMYLLALDSLEQRNEALGRLAVLLREGVRSDGWDFSGVIEHARKRQTPDVEWLAKLADVISGQASLDVLDAWPAWPRLQPQP